LGTVHDVVPVIAPGFSEDFFGGRTRRRARRAQGILGFALRTNPEVGGCRREKEGVEDASDLVQAVRERWPRLADVRLTAVDALRSILQTEHLAAFY
jgi:hypothetical protein